MAEQIQAIRGMNDVLPTQIAAWQHLEDTVRQLVTEYGFEEIRVPIVEHTQLFKRAIGEFTDVVEKEMYTFTDQGGESLTLRPEATAGVVRATNSGASGRCSAASGRRRVAIASFTRWTSRWSDSTAPTRILSSSP